jgi:hypothetical protein
MHPIKNDFLVPYMIILSGALLSFLMECFKAMERYLILVGGNVLQKGVLEEHD